MNKQIYKRLLAGGVVGMVVGAVLLGLSFMSKNPNVFFAGATLMLAGTQCAMNSHVALLRSNIASHAGLSENRIGAGSR